MVIKENVVKVECLRIMVVICCCLFYLWKSVIFVIKCRLILFDLFRYRLERWLFILINYV